MKNRSHSHTRCSRGWISTAGTQRTSVSIPRLLLLTIPRCQFKDAFAIDVKIDFLGVWDTVRSVGLFDRSLPFSTSNNHIRAFRHAISLDERRTKFLANHWNPPSAEDAGLGTQYEEENTDVKEVWFSGGHV